MKIAVTSRFGILNNQDVAYINKTYLLAFKDLDADLFIVSEFNKDFDRIANEFDGLLVTGGEDVNPIRYNEENTESLDVNDNLDDMDFKLIKSFIKVNKPILGICRGLQTINVVCGGSLIQDIPTMFNSNLNHSSKEVGHSVVIKEDTMLSRIIGSEVHVNSYHHQAIKDLAEGFVVSARSSDGLIEAIEKDNIIAVQWHPERMIDQKEHQAIFDYFVSMCK